MSSGSPIDFSGQVAIVTGAGRGLGRAYALELARQGAKIVVNDLGVAMDGQGASTSAAEAVVREIETAGGVAMASTGSVTDNAAMTEMANAALQEWGRIDIFVANAGILRDKTFAKMEVDDFKAVVDVHLIGAANGLKAVWPAMLEQQYGRVVFATSGAGIYGNFGQANYSAAKLGMVGMMKTLNIEGVRKGIRTNAIAPAALTRMTENLRTEEMKEAMSVDNVVPGLVYLCSEDAPEGTILNAGGGVFSVSTIYDTVGIDRAFNCAAEDIRDRWDEISNPTGIRAFRSGEEASTTLAERML